MSRIVEIDVSDVAERQAAITGLRELVEFLDSNPNVPLPFEANPDHNACCWHIYCDEKDEFTATVKAFGNCEKGIEGERAKAMKQFGPFSLKASIKREAVCERIVTGTEDVPELVIPAVPKEVIPAHTKEIVEWRCEPFLSNGHAADEQAEAAKV